MRGHNRASALERFHQLRLGNHSELLDSKGSSHNLVSPRISPKTPQLRRLHWRRLRNIRTQRGDRTERSRRGERDMRDIRFTTSSGAARRPPSVGDASRDDEACRTGTHTNVSRAVEVHLFGPRVDASRTIEGRRSGPRVEASVAFEVQRTEPGGRRGLHGSQSTDRSHRSWSPRRSYVTTVSACRREERITEILRTQTDLIQHHNKAIADLQQQSMARAAERAVVMTPTPED
ncbi:hypothetical protein RIF29_20649 [Crotalaria pallida]|uniref:Uncharacterized protein n=1 Tax=Crotalaria pallida TaxID=3830 RepID=A0AAN9I593_CROPI